MSRGQGVRKKISVEKTADLDSFSSDVVDEVRELFSKVTTYSKPASGEWCMPDPNEAFSQEPEQYSSLQALKASLNEVKNQLSDKNLEVWHQHTSFTNRAGKIIAHVRAAANAEICTQAWCKFYEILGTFGLIPDRALQCGEFNSVHLCEAPGAFVASLNHYLKSNSLYCDWTWVANTLNPYHEANDSGTMITDDRLIANTLPWWFFGSDDTGDIMLQKHLLELQAFTANMRSVDLVTADGSFDCQGNPDEQEALVAPLHYCEAVTALLLLGPGGSFVLKMFTLYEHSSVCLLYLLNCCFRAVHVFKPGTSKAGNSEVYVVCLDYCAKDALRPLLSKMIRNFGPDITRRGALFPRQLIPESFLRQHEEVCGYFHRLQVQTIAENLRLFRGASAQERQRIGLLRDCAVQFYMQRFQVQHLHRSRWLSRNAVPGCSAGGKLAGHRKQAGSFNERKELQSLAWTERLDRACVGRARPGDAGERLRAGRASRGLQHGCLLNEALEQSGSLKGSGDPPVPRPVPPCSSCRVLTPDSLLSEVCGLLDGPHGQGVPCLWVGSPSVLSGLPQREELRVEFSPQPPLPAAGRATLHDAEPRYQRELLACVLRSLHGLQPGGCLVLPLLSALTRFTAGLVLVLHHCFRSVTFRCPASTDALGAVAVLLCTDYRRPPSGRLLDFLRDMQGLVSGPPGPSGPRQVLQFVPMEVLLQGALPDFLWTMNTTITRHRLHLLVQAEQSAAMATP
ncbi:hypothetical protein MATL_G00145120 [Megalops atlanticus]|uniref:Cap-specific mRNA (nucleoside-2'-O-)-methyltransferase 2 n=1 Tax=Megalops atlanticus TaxID=7932 RepID=A0A9D3PV23_MEGAT|nr:hypothetical protein MATL_G00145120 [Megalops atlanticus]